MKNLPPSSISKRRITMRDVAELSGINQASVSVVLNGAKSGGGVSQATRERILRAAQELGYRRNVGAANMKSGRSGWVSLLTTYGDPHSTFNGHILTGVGNELSKHNLHLHVEGVPTEALYEESLWPRALQEWMSDGLILSYGKHNVPELEANLHRHHIPAIWSNAKREADCIYPDDEGAFYTVTQKLLALGHQRILYMVHGNTEHYSTWDRQAGYERAMRDGGFAPEVVTHSDRWEQAERYPTIRSVVERPKSLRPTAVVCYSDTDALNFWSAALATGLRVPEDLSIVAPLTVTPFLEGKYLSGMELNFHEVGAGAVRMLLQKMENPHIKLAPRTVPLGPLTGDTHTVPNH